MKTVKEGKYVDIHCLVMTLPFSNTAYTMGLPIENQECVLHRLKEIFEELGGVPQKIRIDNFKVAVYIPKN